MKTPIIVPFKINQMPTKNAFKWLKNGSILLKSQPLTIISSTAWMFMILLLLLEIPSVGQFLAALAFPALSFGMAEINQKIRLQQSSSVFDIFSGFHSNHRTRILALGAFLALFMFISDIFMQRYDLSALIQFSQKMLETEATVDRNQLTQHIQTALHDPAFQHALLTIYGFAFANIVIATLLCYAPLYVVWQNVEPINAINLSIRTILRNIMPFIITAMIIVFGAFALIGLLGTIATLIPIVGIWLFFLSVFLSIGFIHCVIFTSYHNIIMSSLEKSVKDSLEQHINT